MTFLLFFDTGGSNNSSASVYQASRKNSDARTVADSKVEMNDVVDFHLTLQVGGMAFKARIYIHIYYPGFKGPPNVGSIELQKIYFSYKPMRMPIIAFRGLEVGKKGVSIMDAQYGCGLSCAALSLLSETSPLIGRHSAVQAKGMGLFPPPPHHQKNGNFQKAH